MSGSYHGRDLVGTRGSLWIRTSPSRSVLGLGHGVDERRRSGPRTEHEGRGGGADLADDDQVSSFGDRAREPFPDDRVHVDEINSDGCKSRFAW